MEILLIILLIFKSYSCESEYERIERLFKDINEATIKFNAIGADIAWQSSLDPTNQSLPNLSADYQRRRIAWQNTACKRLEHLHQKHMLNLTQERQAYLLCRGPSYTFDEARELSKLYEELQTIYSEVTVCIPNSESTIKTNLTVFEDAINEFITNIEEYLRAKEDSIHFAAKISAKSDKIDGLCLESENDFEKMMEFSRKPDVLKWLWLVWREKMRPMKEPYRKLVNIENSAAIRNGYNDIGASWRDDLEISNLRQISRSLYKDIKPLYTLLHGVVRFYLRRQYGDVVPEKGPIPAHLLGNLWSQNWEPLADMILPKVLNLDDRMKHLNWTVKDMIKRAEDFYTSLGLPSMTDNFWKKSVFSKDNHGLARCHGSAADMFKNNDFRLLYCSGGSFDDFYVINHEMGHIQYYMAYEHQPGLFRQANSALHETIGDTIMYGVMVPQNLHRLRLINDSELFDTTDLNTDENYPGKGILNLNVKYEDKNLYDERELDKSESNINYDELEQVTIDDVLILKQALCKLPQIPFSLLMDEYRWRYFEGSLDVGILNEEFWAMAQDIQGIAPIGVRSEEYFDIGAKFHVPDNTPYIRYFLSSFLQHQIFEKLCKAAVFGHRNVKDPLPPTIYLNRCDIYGSKAAGMILKDIMSRGQSQHWRQIIKEALGDDDISASALKRYYHPLYVLLMRLIKKHSIPIGW